MTPVGSRDDVGGASPLKGRRCLVLGAGGFIGTNLCRRLQANGAVVQAFGRSQPLPGALGGGDWMTGDFTDHAAVARAVEGNEVIFHLISGSLPESSNKDPIADLSGSVVQTLHLLDIARASGVRKVVFASSGGTVYGIPQQVPIPESAPTNPIAAYGIGKLAIEKYLGLYRHLYGLDYAVLRVANPFGPYQTGRRKQGVIAALARRALDGLPLEIWGTGEVVRDFIYVDDVVSALVASATHDGSHKVFNVGQGEGRSINQIIADLRAILSDRTLDVIYKPGRATDVPVNVLDIGLIYREMGWRPLTSWSDGLRATIEWIRKSAP
ncbi:NAD-dependent epimerase/dehydratase family protein [Nitrospirillum viridazoti]|uniref:NAD-dependent epimerase/dehydratase domain-containing protein n=1 Tax=Nitrospirillum viridazoti CBAmc TaxID=1441467 RepID=A0A248K149_9PROT|nr:NAD-dependent epimerase/dehydratase family protein [Nitrospirillum amazonense]ASG24703.1 hypothetical protein Y958_28060 [Nitrospirillum amazonense CBAmc]